MVNNYTKQLMPIDAIGTGIQMSDNGKAFTINTAFSDIRSFINDLHDDSQGYNMNFVATIIPAFKNDPNYNYTQLLIGNNSGVR